MKTTTILLILTIIFWGCSSPLDQPFSEETAEEDIATIVKSEVLDSSELELIAGYMIKSKLSGEKLEGQTYADILEKAEEFKQKMEQEQAEQRALAEKIEREEAERINRLRKSLTVSVVSKDFVESRFQEYITYKFAFENKSDKAIRAFKGRIVFNDVFDEEISSLNLKYDQPIPAGETIVWNAQSDYNEFIDKDVRLKNKSMNDINTVWEPEKILFADGTTLE